MGTFVYQADSDGRMVSGEIEARDRRMAAVLVRQKGLIPLSIDEQHAAVVAVPVRRGLFSFGFSGKIKSRDITFMTRQLSTLLLSGLPLSRALNFLADQTVNPGLKKMVTAIEEKLQGGATFSDALADHPEFFDSLFLSMVRAGEAGGILDRIMERLAVMRESREELESKVKGALVYPAVMFLAMTGCIMVLMTFVVPRFALLFSDMGQALPLPTLVLMNVSGLIQSVWWIVILLAAAAVIGFKKYTATPHGSFQTDLFKLRLPLIGNVLLTIAMARFCRTAGTLLQSGVPLLTTLQCSVGVAGNEGVRAGIEQVTKAVREGKKLGESMSAAGVFPRYVCEMTTMGEESGTLDHMLTRISENYERDVDQLVKSLTALLEPVMILVMGSVVAFIVMAMLFPIFQMNLMAG